jgi:hypothetical protein
MLPDWNHVVYEYTDYREAFFMPHHLRRCCSNVIGWVIYASYILLALLLSHITPASLATFALICSQTIFSHPCLSTIFCCYTSKIWTSAIFKFGYAMGLKIMVSMSHSTAWPPYWISWKLMKIFQLVQKFFCVGGGTDRQTGDLINLPLIFSKECMLRRRIIHSSAFNIFAIPILLLINVVAIFKASCSL